MNTFILAFSLLGSFPASASEVTLAGAWKHHDTSTTESRIYTHGHFSVSIYSLEGKQFVGTFGGKYVVSGDKLNELIEFDTQKPERVGTEQSGTFSITKDKLTLSGSPGITLIRADDGTPGELAGAWLITGRVVDNELRKSTPGARRTMKILSGTRFQWIAYNVDTKEFSGTGGGTYTTVNGKYTENIEFFSRDNSRVGASLVFDYSLEEGDWHHKGLSSKGEPINEVWTKREKVGL